MKKGNVFDIQRYSIHDGPGIRTVVFLKGCPLRCKWCSNPESWDTGSQLFFIPSKCIQCQSCVHSCPSGEVTMEDSIKVHWDRVDKNVLEWVSVCPTKALSVKGEQMDPEVLFSKIRKDQAFYKKSRGGVTFSGGEPLLQDEFVKEVLCMCKAEGIHTAVETTGCVPKEHIEKVRPYVDLFLYDLKSPDEKIHMEWTGVSSKKILENLKWLSDKGANIFVRTPLIPGVNDQKEDLIHTMEIVKSCGIRHYDILPFHQYGSGKYASCGIGYPMQGVSPHEENYVEELRRMILGRGFSTDLESA